MQLNQNLLYIMFICVFIVLSQLSNTIAGSSDSEAITKTAFYQDLRPDEFMKTWLVLGPIPVSQDKAITQDTEAQKKAFAADLLIQHGGETSIKPQSGLTHQIEDKEFQWQLVQSEDDIVNLIKVYGQKDFVIAYAYAEIDIPETITALLGIGSDDGVKLWLNGKLVHENWIGRGMNKDDDIIPVTFQKGSNQLLLKVQNIQEAWGFACRMLGSTAQAEKLVSSAEQGDLKTIELLLSNGVDVNAKVGPGLTALHVAKIKGREDVAKLLLEKGADPSIEMPAKEEIVDMFFNRVIKADSSGASLAVIKDGSIIYKHGYGKANLEYDIPIIPSTIFHVASVSKQFTAFAIAMLADQGKLSLDDDIHKYLPEIPDFGKTITIRHLIHHTSGLRDQWELLAMSGCRLDDVITQEHIMKIVRHQKELNFAPGEEHLYCNTGYTLLAEIVARVSGKSFPEYTATNIFKPLGMTNTHFHDDHEMIVKNMAYSYAPKGDSGFKKSVLSYANVGATSLFTTVEDLAKWMQNLDDGRVGGAAVIKQMHQRGVLNNGKELDYAFGLSIGEYRGLRKVDHGGADAGYRSYVVRFPDQKFAIAILSNLGSFNPGGIAMQIADVYLSDQLAPEKPKTEITELKAVKVDPALYDAYVGKYQLQPALVINITKEDNRLMLQVTGQSKDELFPESETTFFLSDSNVSGLKLSFQRDETGKINQLMIHQGGQDIPAKRIESDVPVPSQFEEFIGDYYSDELGTIYTIVIQDSQLAAQHRRNEDIRLTAVAADQFAGDKWWFGNVSFIRDENHKVAGFRLTGGRVRNLRFDKQTVSAMK